MQRKAKAPRRAVKRRKPIKPRAVAAPAAGVDVINMIPNALSGETNQDSEPMLAVNPSDVNQLVGTAFTADPMGGPNAPVYVSTDGGKTWVLNPIVPGGGPLGTGDITVAFSGSTGVLYASILRGDQPIGTRLNILKTKNFAGPSTMSIDLDSMGKDQPFAQATTSAGKDRVFVGNNDLGSPPKTATIDVSQNGAAATPNYATIRIEKRNTGGQNGPQVRPAIHSQGTVYAAFYGWRTMGSSVPMRITSDVVVVRDDSWGNGPTPFEALVDPGDSLAGLLVAKGIQFSFDVQGITANGQQRLGGSLSLAVNPGDSSNVYLVWGDEQPATGFTLHIRASNDGGQNWSADLLTLDHATNAAVAVSTDGAVGLLYQQLVGVGNQRRWQTNFQRTTDGSTWSKFVLADTPALNPVKTFDPYLGDYAHLLAVDKDFYGIFSANNTADMAHFPCGVTYQRNVDFSARKLLDVDGSTPVTPSIDPFFFKVKG